MFVVIFSLRTSNIESNRKTRYEPQHSLDFEVDNATPLQDLLKHTGWTAWADADLKPCVRYCLGMHRLSVPQPWLEFHQWARGVDPVYV